MKTVVTGGSGFMGSHMAHLLRCLDHDVTVLTRRTGVSTLASLADILEDISVDELDLHDYNGLCRQVYGADVVFHYAAESHVTKSIENPEPFMYTNAIGTMHLLNACMDMDVPRVVLISSCEVYGEVPSMPPTGALGSTYIQREDYTPLCPKSPYAASKAAADTLAQSYIHTYDMPVVIVRPCNNFGPWQHEEKVIPRFIGQALRNEPITIHGRGLQKREWIYAPDCAEAVYAVHDAHPGIYNIGTISFNRNLDSFSNRYSCWSHHLFPTIT